MTRPIFRSAFEGPDDEHSGLGKRPVVFDVLAPDYETSLLPPGMKMVLHVNPNSMKLNYAKTVERIATRGGFVEQHFGEGAESISFDMATGGFMRLYAGLIGITGGPGSIDVGGTRRDTVAYDTYLDMLALFHNNGAIYDSRGNIVFHGILKCSFDGGQWLGWFSNMTISEEAEKPYQFSLTTEFVVAYEFMSLRSTSVLPQGTSELVSTARDELSSAIDVADFGEDTSSSGWLHFDGE